MFISFANEDKSVADAVKRLLEIDLKLWEQVFMVSDPVQVLAGSDWLKMIRDALLSCEVALIMMSTRSASRPWVNFEAGAAWLAGKHIIPVCFGSMMKGRLPKPYSNWQAVNLPYEMDYLSRSVAEKLGVNYVPNEVKEVLRSSEDERELAGYVRDLVRPNLSNVLKGFKDEAWKAAK